MEPKKEQNRQGEIFGVELERLLDPWHELFILSKKLDWKRFEERFGEFLAPRPVAPGFRPG